jgi:hypothetical protein
MSRNRKNVYGTLFVRWLEKERDLVNKVDKGVALEARARGSRLKGCIRVSSSVVVKRREG